MKRGIRMTALLAAAMAMLPVLAAAHARLQQAVPADGSVVGSAPGDLMLTFSERAHLTQLSIQRQGEPHARRIVALPADVSTHFTVALPALAPGLYTVSYRVVSADDGHISSGTLRFRYDPGAPAR
ncbi:MAG TPA: copper resistance CopC family protein [Steroidobacteraceae bacterium]|jgi:methionine-rich copper-binding protein CopC|nr:copper resistance CopC family protein [Steroidobacteraceae bacterium]